LKSESGSKLEKLGKKKKKPILGVKLMRVMLSENKGNGTGQGCFHGREEGKIREKRGPGNIEETSVKNQTKAPAESGVTFRGSGRTGG